MTKEKEVVITKQDLQNVLNTMIRYNRSEGYMGKA